MFRKLDYPFSPGKNILDVGCGDGMDAVIFRDIYGLDVTASDIFRHENISKHGLDFAKAGIFSLPWPDQAFDYVFLHDVLHHVDEPAQREEKHRQALAELGRVTKEGGTIIILEGNRYNPLFFPHMVKMLGHDHWKQSYFKRVMREAFGSQAVSFRHFEAHAYPFLVPLWKIYEWSMDKACPRQFLAYNIALIRI